MPRLYTKYLHSFTLPPTLHKILVIEYILFYSVWNISIRLLYNLLQSSQYEYVALKELKNINSIKYFIYKLLDLKKLH